MNKNKEKYIWGYISNPKNGYTTHFIFFTPEQYEDVMSKETQDLLNYLKNNAISYN
jgi:hypothetical protein